MFLKSAKHRKLLVSIIFLITIAVIFWSQSRVPALNTKAQMGDRTVVSAIAFDVVYAVEASMPWAQRVFNSTINWAYTNWKGMTFGLLFAAAFLTLLGQLSRKTSNHHFFNALKGLFTGAPLGVCVNCATPIAYGMYQGGLRLEMVLATLMSSPTLNVIVLSMSFTLLPMEFVAVKLLFTISFILLFIPLLSRYIFSGLNIAHQNQSGLYQKLSTSTTGIIKPTSGNTNSDPVCQIELDDTDKLITWFEAMTSTSLEFIKQFLFIIKITVPFMLLAGFLGALLIESVPTEMISSLSFGFLSVLVVAVIGTFLPVPIAFDVIIVSILLSAGIAPGLAMALLFTLGIFSIYPALLLGKVISVKLPIILFFFIMSFGVISGYTVEIYDDKVTQHTLSTFQNEINQSEQYQKLVTIAKTHCQKLPTKQQSNLCTARFVSEQLKKGASSLLCDAFEKQQESKLYNACISAHQYSDIKRRATRTADQSICSELQNKKQFIRCTSDVIQHRIINGEPVSLCEKLSTPQQIENCKLTGIRKKAKRFNSSVYCDELTNPAYRQGCYINFKMDIVTDDKDFTLCQTLDKPIERNYCQKSIALKLVREDANKIICHKLKQQADKDLCISQVKIAKAAKEKDLNACNSLSVEIRKQECLAEVVQAQINYDISMLMMSKISNQYKENQPVLEAQQNHLIDYSALPIAVKKLEAINNITIESFKLNAPKQISKTPFVRNQLVEAHFNEGRIFSLLNFREPFIYGRGIASGDVNNDHWNDVITAERNQILLHINLGEGQFIKRKLSFNKSNEFEPFIVALADFNNDGWLDILVTTYATGNYIFLNDKNHFLTSKPVNIPNGIDSLLTMATGIADIDNNGYLDLILGNWSFGSEKSFIQNYSQNYLLSNDKMSFSLSPMEEVTGETLSVLLSDINLDNHMDAVIANDRQPPDMFYFGNNKHQLSLTKKDTLKIPASSFNTMSIDSADFNNDLHLDLFSVDMSFSQSDVKDYCQVIGDAQAQEACETNLLNKKQINAGNIDWCTSIDSTQLRSDCLIAIFRDIAIKQQDPVLCGKIPEQYPVQKLFCERLAQVITRKEHFNPDDYTPQVQKNRLLIANQKGGFNDVTDTYQVAESHWSWNAKAADLDNDTWQDIFVGNGYQFGDTNTELQSNVFYHNQAGKRFKAAQKHFGLEDYLNTPTYTYIDFDNDGDLDILATGVNAPIRCYENTTSNNAVVFSLKDEQGNTFGIGSKITISTLSGKQIREIKSSGGYMSFDAPIAHFGLADNNVISKVNISWSNGEEMTLNGPLEANHHYIITRKSNSHYKLK